MEITTGQPSTSRQAYFSSSFLKAPPPFPPSNFYSKHSPPATALGLSIRNCLSSPSVSLASSSSRNISSSAPASISMPLQNSSSSLSSARTTSHEENSRFLSPSQGVFNQRDPQHFRTQTHPGRKTLGEKTNASQGESRRKGARGGGEVRHFSCREGKQIPAQYISASRNVRVPEFLTGQARRGGVCTAGLLKEAGMSALPFDSGGAGEEGEEKTKKKNVVGIHPVKRAAGFEMEEEDDRVFRKDADSEKELTRQCQERKPTFSSSNNQEEIVAGYEMKEKKEQFLQAQLIEQQRVLHSQQRQLAILETQLAELRRKQSHETSLAKGQGEDNEAQQGRGGETSRHRSSQKEHVLSSQIGAAREQEERRAAFSGPQGTALVLSSPRPSTASRDLSNSDNANSKDSERSSRRLPPKSEVPLSSALSAPRSFSPSSNLLLPLTTPPLRPSREEEEKETGQTAPPERRSRRGRITRGKEDMVMSFERHEVSLTDTLERDRDKETPFLSRDDKRDKGFRKKSPRRSPLLFSSSRPASFVDVVQQASYQQAQRDTRPDEEVRANRPDGDAVQQPSLSQKSFALPPHSSLSSFSACTTASVKERLFPSEHKAQANERQNASPPSSGAPSEAKNEQQLRRVQSKPNLLNPRETDLLSVSPRLSSSLSPQTTSLPTDADYSRPPPPPPPSPPPCYPSCSPPSCSAPLSGPLPLERSTGHRGSQTAISCSAEALVSPATQEREMRKHPPQTVAESRRSACDSVPETCSSPPLLPFTLFSNQHTPERKTQRELPRRSASLSSSSLQQADVSSSSFYSTPSGDPRATLAIGDQSSDISSLRLKGQGNTQTINRTCTPPLGLAERESHKRSSPSEGELSSRRQRDMDESNPERLCTYTGESSASSSSSSSSFSSSSSSLQDGSNLEIYTDTRLIDASASDHLTTDPPETSPSAFAQSSLLATERSQDVSVDLSLDSQTLVGLPNRLSFFLENTPPLPSHVSRDWKKESHSTTTNGGGARQEGRGRKGAGGVSRDLGVPRTVSPLPHVKQWLSPGGKHHETLLRSLKTPTPQPSEET